MVLARLIRRLAIAAAALGAALAAPAQAHLTPNSEVALAIGHDAVLADIIVPQGEYGYATGNATDNDPAALARARTYLAQNIRVEALDGRPWTVTLREVGFERIAGPPDLHAAAVLTPPPGAGTRRFTIRWHVLIDRLPSHFALFVLTRDSAGTLGEGREILGAVRTGSNALVVDRGAGSRGYAFANALLLGAHHILEGYDHLLFLLTLLLPASLIAQGGRWRGSRPVRDTAGQLLRIVTAFTVGHSLTLIVATVWHLTLPPAPVEVAIAVSVLASAIHAMRPILPGREPLVAMLFGLVHGLAFATLLADAGAGFASGAVSLLGFNLGIELVQIGIVAAVLPPLVVLLREPAFAWLRVATACFAAAASLAWIVNRTIGAAGDVVGLFEAAMAHAVWGLPVLYGLAAACLMPRRTVAAEAQFSGER